MKTALELLVEVYDEMTDVVLLPVCERNSERSLLDNGDDVNQKMSLG